MAPLAAAVVAGPTQAAECTAVQDDTQRLACYDRLHRRAGQLPADRIAQRPATVPPEPAPPPDAPTRLSARWDLDGQAATLFAPRAYRPVYLLPATWTDRVNRLPSSPSDGRSVSEALELRAAETKYQISLKAKFGENLFGTPLDLWGGYTQSSRWQVYNSPASRPFRETNYEPELILVWPLQLEGLGWRLRMASLSITHQSNGRSLPLSRSWNRVIAGLSFERGDWIMELRPWARVREEAKDDDNPDAADYLGRGEMTLARYWGESALALHLRHSLRGGARSHGSAQLDWVFPLSGSLHGYLQVFSGYGESLIDYNLKQTKVGLGVTIVGWR